MKAVVSLDYASMERVAAALTQEGEPIDPYRAEAAKVFNKPESEVTREERETIKHAVHWHLYRPVHFNCRSKL